MCAYWHVHVVESDSLQQLQAAKSMGMLPG